MGQSFVFRAAGIVRCHRFAEKIGCRRQVCTAVSFGEPGNLSVSRAEFLHRRDQQSAELPGKPQVLFCGLATEGARFVARSLGFSKRRSGGQHDGAHGLLEVIVNTRRLHWATLTDESPRDDGGT